MASKTNRITLGIPELDQMLGGGILPRSMVVLAGPAGAGKTITALQFIWGNLNRGHKCLYISASDREEEIIEHALSFGWDFSPFIVQGKLILKFIEPVEIHWDSSVSSDLLELLPRVIEQSRAEVIAIDSITEYLDLCKSEVEMRGRMLQLRRIIKNLGATALLTSEVDAGGQHPKYGIAEYTSDGLIMLHHWQPEDFSVFLYLIQIKKMRWIKHSREMRAYQITERGIEIQSPLYTILASAGKIK